MRRVTILACLAFSACLGGNAAPNSTNNALTQRPGEENRDPSTADPAVPPDEDPGLPPECRDLQSQLAACQEQAGATCASAGDLSNACAEALNAACAQAYDAVNVCFEGLQRDDNSDPNERCRDALDALATCESQAVTPECAAANEDAANCGMACRELEEKWFQVCEPPVPPPAPQDYCSHLHEAFSLCVNESLQGCGVEPQPAPEPGRDDGTAGGPIGRPDPANECWARCIVIEQAIVALCQPEPPPCSGDVPGRPTDPGTPSDPNAPPPSGEGKPCEPPPPDGTDPNAPAGR